VLELSRVGCPQSAIDAPVALDRQEVVDVLGMSSALRLLGPNMLSNRWIEPKPEQMKSDPASNVGSVRAVRRISDSLIRASLPEHDSRLRSITIRFSAASERTPFGTDAATDAESMPPFCTPCAPMARARATQRASR